MQLRLSGDSLDDPIDSVLHGLFPDDGHFQVQVVLGFRVDLDGLIFHWGGVVQDLGAFHGAKLVQLTVQSEERHAHRSQIAVHLLLGHAKSIVGLIKSSNLCNKNLMRWYTTRQSCMAVACKVINDPIVTNFILSFPEVQYLPSGVGCPA